MRKVILPALFLLTILIAPSSSDALRVTIQGTELITVTTINGKPSIVIEGTFPPAGGPNSFTIATCTRAEGCSGFPARVFVDDGATIDNLVLSDAKITAASGTATSPSTLTITVRTDFGDLTPVPSDTYPYAAAMNGLFLGSAARSNSISLLALANAFDFEGLSGDPITPAPLAAPAFSTALSASFNKQGTSNIFCSGEGDCFPSLATVLTLNFVANNTVRLPGSVNVLGSNVSVDNGGLALLAEALAALHPASAAKVLRASLEPSPGPDTSIMVRGVANSSTAWVVDREGNGESKTRAEITLGGAVKIRAQGLCPAGQAGPDCSALPPSVDVSVFCAEGVDTFGATIAFNFVGALELNAKGEGETSLTVPALPCTDPTVLIREPGEGPWIAATGTF
jgi:hypothetical protein